MPSKSPAQHRLMEAAAHTKGGFGGVPQKVGKEFVKADKMAKGGVAQSLKKAGFYEEGKSKPERLKIVSHATTKPERVQIVEKLFSAKKMKMASGSIADHWDAMDDEKKQELRRAFQQKQEEKNKTKNIGTDGIDYTEKYKKQFAQNSNKKMKEGGLYANIAAKRNRIAKGSGERMRKPGAKGAPTADAFKQSAKTAKMSEGGKPDPLAYRIGANIVHKFPREGQTNMRNIPMGNLPDSPNAKLPESKKRMEELRAERPERIKKLIKENLGTHRKPSLPMKSGGKAKKSCW